MSERSEMEIDDTEQYNGDIGNGEHDSNDAQIKSEFSDQNAESEATEEDDPVVKEIPVFVAKTLAQQLYLFQVSQFILNISESKMLFSISF